MATIAPLTTQQIADLFGAVNEFVGTGDNVNPSFQLDFFPVVGAKDVQDELVGLGDGATTIYNLRFAPVASGTLDLRVGSITGTQLVDPGDFGVNLDTGEITLTGSGVTALGTEQLHAKYKTPSTLHLQVGPITSGDRLIAGQSLVATGTLLTEGADYTVDLRTGAITLTSAGVTALGTNDLHALYEIESGFVNVLKRTNAGHRQSVAQGQVNKVLIDQKDASLKEIHEAIEKNTIVDTAASDGLLEAEREWLLQPHTVIFATPLSNQVQASEVIDETKIFDSVDQLFKLNSVNGPLYPNPAEPPSVSAPDPGNPRWPDGKEPRFTEGLSGGTGANSGNEENHLALEAAAINNTITAYPIPPDTTFDRRTDSASTGFPPAVIAALNAEIAALTNTSPPPDKQIQALNNFLAANPTPNEYVTASDIADATTALANANTALTDAQAFLASLAVDAGWSDASLNARLTQIAARQAFINPTRLNQLQALLTTLYSARFFWITQRVRIGDGTLFQSANVTKSAAKATAQVSNNNDRIDETLLILEAQ